jgi:hypothetical protein
VYQSPTLSASVIMLAPSRASYTNSFNANTTDFVGTGFQITAPAGFPDSAVHSNHPYGNNINNTYLLTIPIVVAASNAYIAYDDIAIVEPADAGSVFGDATFNDYIVVEGSLNGSTWIPIANGYNAASDSLWLATWNANTPGTPAMYRHHEFNLLSRFAAGQTILIRFRLYADASLNRWGWAMNNLEIQDRLVGITETQALPSTFALMQNYPNPFNPSTTIQYDVPVVATISVAIYDITGRLVRSLMQSVQQPGRQSIVWNGMNGAGAQSASGIYLYRIEARPAQGGEMFVQQKKMVLIK